MADMTETMSSSSSPTTSPSTSQQANDSRDQIGESWAAENCQIRDEDESMKRCGIPGHFVAKIKFKKLLGRNVIVEDEILSINHYQAMHNLGYFYFLHRYLHANLAILRKYGGERGVIGPLREFSLSEQDSDLVTERDSLLESITSDVSDRSADGNSGTTELPDEGLPDLQPPNLPCCFPQDRMELGRDQRLFAQNHSGISECLTAMTNFINPFRVPGNDEYRHDRNYFSHGYLTPDDGMSERRWFESAVSGTTKLYVPLLTMIHETIALLEKQLRDKTIWAVKKDSPEPNIPTEW